MEIHAHDPEPDATPGPAGQWGSPERGRERLDRPFEQRSEPGTSRLRDASGSTIRELLASSLGPTRTLTTFHYAPRTWPGVAMPDDDLVTIGVRK